MLRLDEDGKLSIKFTHLKVMLAASYIIRYHCWIYCERKKAELTYGDYNNI